VCHLATLPQQEYIAKPVSGKVYRLKVKVPPELIGEAEATVSEQ